MTKPTITLELHPHSDLYCSRDTLAGHYCVVGLAQNEARAAELSVLWYTIGQGEEDLAIHSFERHASDESEALNLESPQYFETTLPLSPVSYDGILVKICWCVRLRVFLTSGKELLAEVPFQLETTPPAKMVVP